MSERFPKIKKADVAAQPDLFGYDAPTAPARPTPELSGSARKKVSAATEFLRWWGREYAARFERTYMATFNKDTALIKTLLLQITMEDAQIRAAEYLDDRSNYLMDRGHTIGLFFSKINEYPRGARTDRRDITRDDINKTYDILRTH